MHTASMKKNENTHNSTPNSASVLVQVCLLSRCSPSSSELRRGAFAHICQPAAAGSTGGAAAGGNAHRRGEQSWQTGQRQGCRLVTRRDSACAARQCSSVDVPHPSLVMVAS